MKNRGFSLIDAMLGALVLCLGLVFYVKTTSGTVASSIDNYERQMVAIFASDLNNIFDAHVNILGSTATQAQVIAAYQALSSQLQQELKRAAAIRGYECVGGKPVLLGTSVVQPQSNSTLIRSWGSGAYVCVEFLLRDDVPTNFNGVWVETKISWIGLRSQKTTPDFMIIPSLIAPSSL